MENKRNIRRWLPVAAALAVFVLINLFYFAPQFSGQTLLQGDVQQYKGSSEDIMQHRREIRRGPALGRQHVPGGSRLPDHVQYEGTVIKTLSKAFYFLGQPAALIFIAMTAFFFMLLCMRFNPWIGIVPSLAYGFSTYFFIIIGAGHVTKMMALAFAPMLFGGVWYAFRRNMWVGAALTGVFASIEIGVNHPQITYYFLFILAAFWINELVSAAACESCAPVCQDDRTAGPGRRIGCRQQCRHALLHQFPFGRDDARRQRAARGPYGREAAGARHRVCDGLELRARRDVQSAYSQSVRRLVRGRIFRGRSGGRRARQVQCAASSSAICPVIGAPSPERPVRSMWALRRCCSPCWDCSCCAVGRNGGWPRSRCSPCCCRGVTISWG